MSREHSHCPAAEGWQGRLQTKLATAGVGGTLVGAALSVLQQGPFLRYAFGTAASWVICVGGFAVCQETSRLLRCDDSAANSIVAGAATGALLLGLQRGKNASLPAAIVCGSAAGAWHVLDDRLQPVAFFQQWLVDNDLMDLSGVQQKPSIRSDQYKTQPASYNIDPSANSWGDIFGIKRLSDAEWKEHEEQRRTKFDKRLARAGLGPDERMVQQRGRSEQNST